MLPAVKDEFLTVLRSGKVPQSRFHLREGAKFCIFGILCELYRRATGNGTWRDDTFVLHGRVYIESLPKRVQLWAGLDTVDVETCAYLNDGDIDQTSTYSFPFIADNFVAPFL